MSQAHAHLAFAPRGPGLLYAVTWMNDEHHVYGWYLGSRDGEIEASYFMLQGYYDAHETAFLRSVQDDLDGVWVEARYSGGELPLTHSPLPEAVRHELARLQDQFVRHWLFFEGDAEAATEGPALRARDLPVRRANIQASRLDKLTHGAAVWRYDSPGSDLNVLAWLTLRWPLDFRTQE